MSDVFRGPYANSENAPLLVQRCICPLSCPEHPDIPLIDPAKALADQINQSEKIPELISSYVTQPSIVPVVIENASEILAEAGLTVQEMGESIVIKKDKNLITFSYEVANALCQEILDSKKRIELTLPETLDMTLKTLKQRVGHDMAPLVDMIEKMLKNKNG
jgi:DNA-binding transcriptional regulator YhcF (GntR family)